MTNPSNEKFQMYVPILISLVDACYMVTDVFGKWGIDPSVVIAEVIKNVTSEQISNYSGYPGSFGAIKVQLPDDAVEEGITDDFIKSFCNGLENEIINQITQFVPDVVINGLPVRFYYPNGLELYVYIPLDENAKITDDVKNRAIPAQAIATLNY